MGGWGEVELDKGGALVSQWCGLGGERRENGATVQLGSSPERVWVALRALGERGGGLRRASGAFSASRASA